MDTMSFQGKTAVVTGGAGGIGTGICRVLARAGGNVVVIGQRDEKRLQDAVSALPQGRHMAARVSVADSPGLRRLADKIEKEYGGLDLLVNNAGMTKLVAHHDLDGLNDELIDHIFRVNLRGPFACVRAFRRLLEKDAGGVVVNITSDSVVSGNGSNIAYIASKAGLDSMTMTLARALAPKIRVVAVAPGFVDTGFVSKDPSWTAAAAAEAILKKQILPEDIGAAVLSLATVFEHTTGCAILVDGGK